MPHDFAKMVDRAFDYLAIAVLLGIVGVHSLLIQREDQAAPTPDEAQVVTTMPAPKPRVEAAPAHQPKDPPRKSASRRVPKKTPAVVRKASILLASATTVRTSPPQATRMLSAGQTAFTKGDLFAARQGFECAVHVDPSPLAFYMLSLVEYRRGNACAATQHVATAVNLERTRPITNWGRTMERYQGQPRMWLENERARLR